MCIAITNKNFIDLMQYISECILQIPIFGEQMRNAAAQKKHRVALTLTKEDLEDSEKLTNFVGEMLSNDE